MENLVNNSLEGRTRPWLMKSRWNCHGRLHNHWPSWFARPGSSSQRWTTFCGVSSSITSDGRDSVQRSFSQDEHRKDKVIKLIFLVLYSMPIPWISHLPSWTTYLDDDIGLDFPYAIIKKKKNFLYFWNKKHV